VLGLTGALSPTSVAVSRDVLAFDMPVMLAVSIACLPIFFHRYRIDRWEGVVFLLYYVAYITYQAVHATHPTLLPPQSTMMLWFLVPITIVTIVEVLLHARGWNHRRTGKATAVS
jgi:cation:H+ antiporter